MAYNPFDDVIDQDPAYMAEGGLTYNPEDVRRATSYLIKTYGENTPTMSVPELSALGARLREQPVQEPPTTVPVPDFISQGQQIREKQQKLQELQDQVPGAFYQSMQPKVQERRETDFSDVQQTIGAGLAPIYETVSMKETSDRTKQKKEKNEQIKEQLGFGNQLSKSQLEQAKQYGYEPLTVAETFSQPLDFLYGDQAEAFRKLADGEQLEAEDKYNLIGSPLDAIDFVGAGVATGAIFKLLKRVRDKYKVPNLKEILDNPAFAGEPDVEEVRALTVGAMPPPGLPIEQGGRQQIMFDKPDVPDRPGGSSFSLNADDLKLPESKHFRAKDTDEKFKKLILENPEGTSLKSKEWFRENYGMEVGTFNQALKRFEEANPDIDFSMFKRDSKESQKANIKIANEKAKQEFVKKIEGLKTIEDVMKETGLTYTGAYDRIKNTLGNEGLRKYGVSPGVKTGETAAKVDEFLSANKNRNFTLPELAEEMGINYNTLSDQYRYGRIADTSNIVSKEFRRGEMFDSLITEMNRLLKDINTGKIPANKGPKYYQEAGYNIQMVSDEDIVVRPYTQFPQKGNEQSLSMQNRDLKKRLGKKSGSVDEDVESILNYIDFGTDPTATKRNALKIKLRDLYRSLIPKNQEILFDNVTDPEAFGFVPKKIINEYGVVVDNLEWSKGVNKKAYDNLYAVVESLTSPEDIKKLQELQKMKKSLNQYTDKKFYNALRDNDAFRQQFIDQVNRVDPNNKYNNDWEAIYRSYKNMFNGHLSHVAPTRKLGTDAKPFAKAPGLEGKFGESGLINLNFDNHNISLQPRIENATEAAVKDLTKARTVGDQTEAIQRIIKNNRELKKRHMMAYMRFTDDEMSDAVFDYLKKQFPNQVFKTTEKYGKTPAGIKTFILGDPKPPKVNDLKKYFDSRLDVWLKDPKTFKLSAAVPDGKKVVPDQMMIEGDAPYIFMKKLLPSSFKKGGPVKMAMGGDPLANMNQQQFMPDPAFEGEDYFNQAVESGNLYAFNPMKIFKLFNKTDAVYTPKKLPDPVGQQQAAPPGTTLPTTQVVQPEDFAFESFTLNKINDPQAPKAGTPEAWKQFLYGGGQGGKVPEAEMFDTGLEQYLDDYARYYPDKKITKQELNDYYEMSPIGNIEIKVKADLTNEEITNPGYRNYVGRPRHQNSGSQPLDRIGTNYREIVVNSGPLPGDKKPFVESGHFNENNVLGFTRVANYNQPDGTRVAVIQEMQTDMLTKVRKEQERLNALLKRIENIKATAAREIQSGDPYRETSANRALEALNAKFPPAVEEALRQHSDLIKPFPNQAARSSIPDYQKQLMDLQKNIDEVLASDLQQSKPETPFRIQDISQQQQKILDSLLDLNRSNELEDMLKNVQVPGTTETEQLLQYGNDSAVLNLETGARSMSLKNLELFPPIPFNKQADYVDLLLKSTIKDAQARGINKVAIYPPDLINQRWGKNPDSDAGKKFRDLYGKVAIQQMKNIAKKYGGDAKVETVLNPDASNRGLTYYKTNVDGEYELMKQDQLAQGLEPEEAQLFIDEQLKRNANSLGANQVIYSREIAPGQTMDYYVQPKTITETTDTGGTIDFEDFELVPLGPGDDRNAAQVLIEEYNPQEVQMFTITLDSDKAKGPMFMFKKKSGGSIDKDSLVSITDIFGEYGR
jgi:hypothetical protein